MKKYILIALSVLAVACEKNSSDEPFKGTFKVSGTVEKGPFVQGSTINMQTLDDKLHPTGKTFMENIKDDAGTFDFGSLEFDTPYAKITATGYFFNEVTGELSKVMINLNALVDLSDKSSVKTTEDGGYLYYTVKSGDNLWDIAKKFDGVSYEQIMKINGFTKKSKIYPGNKIKIKKL